MRRKVGADHGVAVASKSECLSANADRHVEHVARRRPELLDERRERRTLAGDARIPVGVDQVVPSERSS